METKLKFFNEKIKNITKERSICIIFLLIMIFVLNCSQLTYAETAIPNMVVKTMVNGTESIGVNIVKYSSDKKITVNGVEKTGIVYRLDVPYKGILNVRVLAKTLNNDNITFGLYENSTLDKIRGNETTLEKGQDGTTSVEVFSKTSLYLAIYTDGVNSGTDVLSIQPYFYGAIGKTLTNNVSSGFASLTGHPMYFKYKATQTGYLIVKGYNLNPGTVKLYNASKKALSVATIDGRACYGVIKGKTYYILISPKGENRPARIVPINKYIYERSGKNITSAVLKQKNKYWRGSISAGNNKSDWYKFKLKKKKSVKLTVTGATSGIIKVAFYNGYGKNISKTKGYVKNGKLKLNAVSKKLYKGTYYIKVYRGTKYSSGYYKLKWN